MFSALTYWYIPVRRLQNKSGDLKGFEGTLEVPKKSLFLLLNKTNLFIIIE